MPISWKRPAVERNGVKFGTRGYFRKHTYNFRKLANVKVHAQIWQFKKSACISETAVRRAKISSISTLYGRKTMYMSLLELPIVKFHAQIWHF